MKLMAKGTLLTLLGLLLLCGVTAAAMWFITHKLTLASAYWLVPVFGALGGAVGGILRSENVFELCTVEAAEAAKDYSGKVRRPSHAKVCLGTLGEIAVGLGGSVGAVFLFGGTLKFDESDPKTYVLLISVSFLAGAFGKVVVEAAGNRLLNDVKNTKKDVKIAQIQADGASVVAYTLMAGVANNQGDAQTGLRLAESALELDNEYITAYIEKGRALWRMGRREEALNNVETALSFNSNRPDALYNRACYKLGLGGDLGGVLEDLRRAFETRPKYKELAKKDPDLVTLASVPEFARLVE